MTVIADTYQAAIAVISPRYPPSTVRPACELKAPIASTKNVMVNRMNTTSTGRLKVIAATVIYAVKMPHASKNVPTAAGRASAGIPPTLNVTRSANAIQNAAIRGERRRTKRVVSLKLPHTCTELSRSAVAEGYAQNNGFCGFWNQAGVHSRENEGGQAESQRGRVAPDRRPIEPAAPL